MTLEAAPAVYVAVLSSGLFLVVGMLTGLWKYRCIITSPDAKAPQYVDVCHRTALMYSFACLVLAEFARWSAWPSHINVLGVVVPVLFFASAVASYALHGVLRDTDNQLERPHRLGSREIHSSAVTIYVYALVVGELGGFLILFSGSVRALVG